MNSSAQINVPLASAELQKYLADHLSSVELSFVESNDVVDTEVERVAMMNPPRSNGVPVIAAESFQNRVTQLERDWRRSKGSLEDWD